MNKEKEAQQAQTINRIGEMLNTPWGHDVGVWVGNCEDLREIVDYQAQKIVADKRVMEIASELMEAQAQKITDQARIIATNAAYAIELQGKLSEQEKQLGLMTLGIRSRDVKIAEQAKEIELFREYKETVETEILIDTKYDAPDESWVDAVGLKINALEQTTDSKEG